MRLSELLRKLRQFDIEVVGKLQVESDQVIYLGRLKEFIFPKGGTIHPIYADPGTDDFEVHPEETAAILRRFEVDEKKFEQA